LGKGYSKMNKKVYETFDDWYHEIEGFALRAERLMSPEKELRAAFEAARQEVSNEVLGSSNTE
jgi:hypothetical protein